MASGWEADTSASLRHVRAPALPEELGERLERPDYKRDFRERRAAIRDGESWKLERLQHFEETNDDSRDALRRGDWPEVLRLFEAERDALSRSAREEEARGAAFRRIRVVEEPLTPYVQWELHWLRLSAECGHPVRVLPAAALAAAETGGLLPELTLLGGQTRFRVVYTDAGQPDGAIRFTDPGIVTPWVAYVKQAYAAAEDIETYFERAVAHLPPPPAA